MKIAQLAPPFISIPPENYGGIELVVHNLEEALSKRNHEVTVYAAGGSQTTAKLVHPFSEPLGKGYIEKYLSPVGQKIAWMHSLPSLYHAIQVFEDAKEFDIIHDHFHYIGLLLSSLVTTPVVSTYHGDFLSLLQSPIEKMILEKYPDHPWIAISESQKNNCPIKLNFIGVVHHGIPIQEYEYSENDEGYMAWLGRLTPKKGLLEAIQIAKKLNYPLRIAGIVNPRDQEFYDTQIKPHIDNNLIKMYGSVSFNEKNNFLKNARLLLYPITWEEPFGLVMSEAMATGTPVIGFAHGSVPEIISDGESGYIINSNDSTQQHPWVIKTTGVDGMIEAAEKIIKMTETQYKELRMHARQHVERNFTVDTMVQKYENLYKKVLNSS